MAERRGTRTATGRRRAPEECSETMRAACPNPARARRCGLFGGSPAPGSWTPTRRHFGRATGGRQRPPHPERIQSRHPWQSRRASGPLRPNRGRPRGRHLRRDGAPPSRRLGHLTSEVSPSCGGTKMMHGSCHGRRLTRYFGGLASNSIPEGWVDAVRLESKHAMHVGAVS
jgi:hypothetical protein